jgi:hypothetical protein
MSFLSSTRLRRASILLAGTTAAAVLLPLPAMAGGAPGTTPTITAPNDGDNFTTSPVTVTATSFASKVRFIVGSKGTPVDQKTVDVVAGTASTTVDVLGATGSTVLRAADCDVAGTTCNEVSEDTVTVTVNLQNPSITSPTDHAVVGNQVTLKADAPGGRLQISVDGNTAGTPVAVPVNKNVSLTAKSQGSHTISVQQCNAAGTICDGDTDDITVIKDTQGPKWSDVGTSNHTVFRSTMATRTPPSCQPRLASVLSKRRLRSRKPAVRSFAP